MKIYDRWYSDKLVQQLLRKGNVIDFLLLANDIVRE